MSPARSPSVFACGARMRNTIRRSRETSGETTLDPRCMPGAGVAAGGLGRWPAGRAFAPAAPECGTRFGDPERLRGKLHSILAACPAREWRRGTPESALHRERLADPGLVPGPRHRGSVFVEIALVGSGEDL